jgi:hypothetical protein
MRFHLLRIATRIGALVLAVSVSLFPTSARADSSYNLKVETQVAKKGSPGVARILVAPGAGYHVNKSYPWAVTVAPPAGVTVDRPKQGPSDAVRLEEAGAEFDVRFTAADVGKKTFTGELKFAVCSDSSCDPKKEKLSFVVEVQ